MGKQFNYDNLPVVQTKAGKLHGYQSGGTYIFKGIPYATAKRFCMPEEIEPWDGVKAATSYGFVCPTMQKENPNEELLVPHRFWPQDENCLNLNIWTQSLEKTAKKAVLVWIHGGGFIIGNSIDLKAYNGENMSKYGDVVVVSINHRLNVLGYFDLSPYGEKYADSANLGQEDLIAALRWIRENIAAFGGDPDNVTVFGQSGGGMKISALMQMPAADGLFHKGVIMSGVIENLFPYSTEDSRPLVQAVLAELGLTEAKVEKLETVPYHELARAYKKVSSRPEIQKGYVGCVPKPNAYFKGRGHIVGFREHAVKIPLIVGTVFGEYADKEPPFKELPFAKDEVSEKDLQEVLARRFGEYKEVLAAEFQKAYPGKNLADLLALDTLFRCPAKQFMRAFAEAGGTVYSYLFSLEFPYHHGMTAWHCSELPFVFHNTGLVPIANIPEVSDQLESRMFHALISFAKTGNPNHPQIPEWPSVRTDDEPTMIFDRECEVRHNFDDKLLQLYLKA